MQDDCWAAYRFPNGTIHADPTTFPSGMKALADYVHSKGWVALQSHCTHWQAVVGCVWLCVGAA